MLIPINRPLFFLPKEVKIGIGLIAIIIFIFTVWREAPDRRQRYISLAIPLLVLSVSPINTQLNWQHMAVLGGSLAAVLLLPVIMLRHTETITYKILPDKLEFLDVLYTLISIPLAWGAFKLYFGVLSPHVPHNWVLPAEPNTLELLKLFMGINAVGIWDELFFINTSFAILRSLFPYRMANLAQAVIYMSVLYSMAFSGWGPLFVFVLALTQGAMYERSKALIWVLIVHLIVDYFLFQAIVSSYYPDFSVWWH